MRVGYTINRGCPAHRTQNEMPDPNNNWTSRIRNTDWSRLNFKPKRGRWIFTAPTSSDRSIV